jgi:hypothetical protein
VNKDNSPSLEDILSQYQLINLEEDITKIKNNLVIYNTSFNTASYKNGLSWNNICANKTASNSLFTFDNAPVYSRQIGFYLGNNRIIGPDSSLLNIDFNSQYTIVLVCKHGNLVTNNNDEIELIKLYANSPNNNGIALFIQGNSLNNANNIQTGTLLFQQGNADPLPCLMSSFDTTLNFEKDVLTFYYIIKGNDNIRILTMNEKKNTINELLKFNISNTDINFSNKEFVINRFKNWNANIFNFAVYNSSLTDDEITSNYNHILSEYMKYLNPNFQIMVKQYNETITILSNFLKCPFDKITCDACNTITKWNDTSQLISASSTCRKAINDFCSINTTNPLCKCWNNSSPLYNSNNCKMYRSIFSGKNTCLDTLSQEDLDYLRAKYGLIFPDQCPKEVKAPTYLKNTDHKYDYSNIKINDGVPEDDKILNRYTGQELKKEPKKEEYTWDKLKVRFDEDKESDSEDEDNNNNKFKVKNYFKQSEPLKKSISKQESKQETKQETIIKPPEQLIKNYFKDFDNQPMPQQPSDTFFNKFMKIIY